MKRYFAKDIESKWQEKWKSAKTFTPDLKESKNPYYSLMMFPYPSAEGLHVGNMYAFTGTDIFGRFKRMQGFDVFEPIGLDGFGIHSENYALKVNEHPMDLSKRTEKRFYEQLTIIGNGFAWDHTVETYKPGYYKWTQWLFLQMYKKGLAYRKKAEVNWCPSCKTVLADEQVIAGECERCGSLVEKRELEQWFFKITEYADRLLENLDHLDWSEKVTTAQRNWIGKSKGAMIKFGDLEVFTTRPDTVFGATFMVISPEHPRVNSFVTDTQKEEVSKYIETAENKTDEERRESKVKTGVFTGSYVKNPATSENIPVWIADYVLMGYGTGAIMAVPAHDERDFEFAQKYNLDIRVVVEPELGETRDNEEERNSIVAILYDPKEDKYLSINWGKNLGGNLFVGGGLENNEDIIEAASREIKEETGYQNFQLVSTTENIHYHYVAHSKGVNRKIKAVGLLFKLEDEKKAETHLEENERDKFTVEWLNAQDIEMTVKDDLHSYVFKKLVLGNIYTGEGILVNSGDFTDMDSAEARVKIVEYLNKIGLAEEKTQYHLRDWLISRQRYWGPPIPMVYCDKCGVVPVPEDDLPVELPYVENFRPTGTGTAPLAMDESFINTTCPSCNSPAKRETDVSDTFLDSSWYFLRYPSTNLENKAFDNVLTKKWLPVDMYIGGAEHSVLHLLYSRFVSMVLHDIGLIDFEEPFEKFRAHGLIIKDGAKMSKSKGNIVNPDDYIKEYGADTLRTYLMFLGPFSEGGDFRDSGMNGIYNFLQRVWKLLEKVKEDTSLTKEDLRMMNKTIKKVGEDVDDLKYNTAIASLMEWLNHLTKRESTSKEEYRNFLLMLAPFAPHITEELWSMIGEEFSIHTKPWPKYDEEKLAEDKVTIVIQVNGKVRDNIVIDSVNINDQKAIEEVAFKSEKVQKFLNGQTPLKTIYVPGKILNLVLH